MRLRLVALAFLASNANLTLPAKSFATQDIPAESPECRKRSRWIKAEFRTKVSSITQSKYEYDDAPANKPLSSTFAMTGSATKSIIYSQKFLTNVSANIVSKCPCVSLIGFGFNMSDFSITFSLMKNGQIHQFNCIEARGESVVPIYWGQVIYM
jgi:hypothetical protein